MDVYMLGGHDLEMREIQALLDHASCARFDKNLRWGAKASDYAAEIADVLDHGNVPVLVELTPDLPSDLLKRCVLIDHHNDQAGGEQPSALEQVARRLEISAVAFAENRWWMLVAANDKGHLRGLRGLSPPATEEEIRRVRTADLQAQGVTEEDFRLARQAVAARQVTCDGRLTIVTLAHDRTGLAAEVMEPFFGGPGFRNLLVIGATQHGFYGEGRLVQGLVAVSPPPPDSWSGGLLPESGFWGAARDAFDGDVVSILSGLLPTGATTGS